MNEKKIVLITGQRGSGKSTYGKHKLKEYSRIIIFDTLGEYSKFGVVCETLKELAEFWDSKKDGNFKIVYQPLNPFDDFPILCDLVFSCGDMCFYVEEIDTFLASNTQGLDVEFLNLVQRGRHKNVELIGITQRPYSIPPILRSQAKIFVCFKQTESRDIDYLKNIFGQEAEKIRNLETFEYLKYEEGIINHSKTSTNY